MHHFSPLVTHPGRLSQNLTCSQVEEGLRRLNLSKYDRRTLGQLLKFPEPPRLPRKLHYAAGPSGQMQQLTRHAAYEDLSH